MRGMTGDVLVCESLLYLYYDKMAKMFLNQEIVSVVDRFIMYCKAKDIVDDTNIVEAMEVIYDPQKRMSKDELKKKLAMSDSSLYRFRIKLVQSLYKYIRQSGDK